MVPARHLGLIVALTCSVVLATCSSVLAQSAGEPVEIEVLPVLELQVTINKAVPVKGKNAYQTREVTFKTPLPRLQTFF